MPENTSQSLQKFVGKWRVTSTENMEEMLKAFDMEDAKRALYAGMRFTMEYRYNSDTDTWTNTVYMPNGVSKSFVFSLGKEFDSTTLDGRPILSMIECKDGKFVEVHKDKEDATLDARMTREICGEELLVTAEVRKVKSVTRHVRE